jgi:hypothetical protein
MATKAVGVAVDGPGPEDLETQIDNGPESNPGFGTHSGPLNRCYFFFAGAFLVSFLGAGLSVPFLVPHFAMATSF